ncbi:AMP-binding protein, partial [Pseudoalteromonas sp. MMG012]|uniref:AMP-binding protein n=1 Tax=Pseudoalteromonas sp. MMG012 TaxID=2822686 RepID=UPI001B3A318B
GSTGKPKGVMIEHRALANYQEHIRETYNVDDNDAVLQFSNICFDIFVEEFFGTLCQGARLVISNDECRQGLQEFISFCTQNTVSVVSLPTAFWAQLLVDKGVFTNTSIRLVIVGGEALTPSTVSHHYQKLGRHVQLMNTYGPTEATITASTYCTSEADAKCSTVSIGQPNINNQLLILDLNTELVPFGAVGELYIGGDGLARGYLNRAALTTEQFIENPYFNANDPHSSQRIYRTGDLVRYLVDGTLEFIGRADDQVKIRGFRVELGEVEAQLVQQQQVESALVMTKMVAGGKQLVAYIQPSERLETQEHMLFMKQVKSALTEQLPEYMVPSVLMVVHEWPLTPNGKVDKRALPTPKGATLQGDYVAPQTQIELGLVEIWSELLGIEAVGISTTANFFEIGGHSLLMLRLCAQMKQRFGVEISLNDLFSTVTIEAMARLCDGKSLQADGALIRAMSDIQAHHRSVFLIPGVASTEHDFAWLASTLSSHNINVYGCPHRGLLDGLQPFKTLTENAEQLAEAIATTVKPHMVIQLVGHSFGGVLALEAANMLRGNGFQVELTFVDVYFEQSIQMVKSCHVTPVENKCHTKDDAIDSELLDRVNLLAQRQTNWFDNYVPTVASGVVLRGAYAGASPYCLQAYNDYMAQHSANNIESITIDTDHKGILKQEELSRFIVIGCNN